jgi:integrase
LNGLKPEHLQRYQSEKLSSRLSAQTVRHHHTCLHKALQTAVEWGLLARNPADAVKPPKAQHPEMKTWNENEVDQFLEAAKSTQYYALFFTLLYTGMRRSELLALRWQDIDFIYGQVSVSRSMHYLIGGKVIFRQPKTAKGRRTVALPPSAFLVLNDYHKNKEAESILLGKPLSDNDLVFSDIDGKPFLPNTVTHNWIKLVRRTGIKPIRLHDARHTHASLMLKQGIHPKIVQERLGHASIQITLDTYSHVAPGLQEAAAKRFDDAMKVSHNEHGKEAIEKNY